MTDISQYTLDLDCAAGVLPEAVELRLLPSHSRLVDTELEASITAEWEAKLGKHPRMFNGAKFRYGCARVADGGRVCFELALTDYRSMIGTSLSSRLPEIASRGEPRLHAGVTRERGGRAGSSKGGRRCWSRPTRASLRSCAATCAIFRAS